MKIVLLTLLSFDLVAVAFWYFRLYRWADEDNSKAMAGAALLFGGIGTLAINVIVIAVALIVRHAEGIK
jgi:hypothetical protein